MMTQKTIPKRKRVVIIGAGFGGIHISQSLAKADIDIILVDKHNYHAFLPLLYQVATGGLEPSNIAYPVRRIIRGKSNLRFVMAEVNKIHTESKKLESSIGSIWYDYLIIATGSKNNFFNFEPIRDRFLSLKSVKDALQIRNHLMRHLEALSYAPKDAQQALVNVAIIGAGPSGVEVAGALAEMRKRVLPRDFPEFDFANMRIHIFEAADRVLSAMSAESSKYALDYLKQLDVSVQLNSKVEDYDGQHITLEGGTTFKTQTAIWTAGVQAATISGLHPESFTPQKRIHVNTYNQLFHHESIFAIGDVAATTSETYEHGHPMVAQVAIQQGEHLAQNIKRLISDRPLVAFEYNDKGSMATIGRNKAVVDLNRIKFQGFFAWFVWMFIHLLALVGFRNKLFTFINWTYNYFSYERPLGAILQRYDKTEVDYVQPTKTSA